MSRHIVVLSLLTLACASVAPKAIEESALDQDLDTADRQEGLNPLCREVRIRPALNCGCFNFRADISNRGEWAGLRRMCIRHLGGSFRLGRGSCLTTEFEPTEGNFRFRTFERFFRRTRVVCVPGPRPADFSPSPTPTPSKSPAPTPSKSPAPTPSKSPAPTPSRSPARTPSKSPARTPSKSPARTPSKTPSPSSFPVDPLPPDKFPAGLPPLVFRVGDDKAASRSLEKYLELSPFEEIAFRQLSYRDVHPSLSNMCLTMGWFMGVSRRTIIQRCCPRDVRTRGP